MIVLLDNTVLSNFALVESLDLLARAVVPHAATTGHVIREFEAGIVTRRLAPAELGWLPQLTLSSEEQRAYERLAQRLNAGEASCLAVAGSRSGKVLTDDRDARIVAGRLGIPISGTLGVLVQLIEIQEVDLQSADRLLARMISEGYYAPFHSLRELL
jgi:predicted nucleic acid-binding protein